MFTHKGKRIGDIWLYVAGDTAHCYYLVCEPDMHPFACDIGHATSKDLVNWDVHDLALCRDVAGSWDEALATGSVLERDGKYWMSYTGHTNQEVGLATSEDLFNWEKVSYNPLPGLDPNHYEEISHGVRAKKHWRDPYLFEHGDWVYYIVCASGRKGPEDGRGTIGMARSKDMINWEVLPPPELDPMFQEMECPQMIQRNGLYYLVFSTGPKWVSSIYNDKYAEQLTAFAPYSMVGESPMGPFKLHDNGRILPLDFPYRIWAPQVVTFKGDDFLMGTILHGESTGASDPIYIEFTPTGVKVR